MTTMNTAREEQLLGMAKNIRWYKNRDLDDVADLIEAGNYEGAYYLAAQLDKEQYYFPVDDIGFYKADFHRILAGIMGVPYHIRNLTPHAINIVGEDGEMKQIIAPEEKPARLKVGTVRCGFALGVPLSKSTFGEPENLPEPQEGVLLIVSQLIKGAFPDREDLVVPAEMVRDNKGNIIGCKSLGL